MDITFLGTGSAMPTGDRYQTGLLLTTDDHHLLLDCGSGIIHRLAQTHPGYEGIEAVLLTHHHLDHVSDLMPLLKARWLAGETDLTIAGPPGTRTLLTRLLDVHSYMQDRLDLTLTDLDPTPFTLAGFDITPLETRHSLPGYAYRFTTGHAAFTFSGDTEAFDGLAEFADGSTVLAHDCSFPDDVDVSNHPTPTQLARILVDRDIGTVILTHLYPHTTGKHEEMRNTIRKHYDGTVRIAHDGLNITV